MVKMRNQEEVKEFFSFLLSADPLCDLHATEHLELMTLSIKCLNLSVPAGNNYIYTTVMPAENNGKYLRCKAYVNFRIIISSLSFVRPVGILLHLSSSLSNKLNRIRRISLKTRRYSSTTMKHIGNATGSFDVFHEASRRRRNRLL
jgi:hypothetical protein